MGSHCETHSSKGTSLNMRCMKGWLGQHYCMGEARGIGFTTLPCMNSSLQNNNAREATLQVQFGTKLYRKLPANFSSCYLCSTVHSSTLYQCFSTAGPRPSSGPWHQLYWVARGSSGICHFHFLSAHRIHKCTITLYDYAIINY
jgi:hypothetical protein